MKQRLQDIGARVINKALWTRHPHNTPELRKEAKAWIASTVDGKQWLLEQREPPERVAEVERLHRSVEDLAPFLPTRHHHIGGCCGTLVDNESEAPLPEADEEDDSQ